MFTQEWLKLDFPGKTFKEVLNLLQGKVGFLREKALTSTSSPFSAWLSSRTGSYTTAQLESIEGFFSSASAVLDKIDRLWVWGYDPADKIVDWISGDTSASTLLVDDGGLEGDRTNPFNTGYVIPDKNDASIGLWIHTVDTNFSAYPILFVANHGTAQTVLFHFGRADVLGQINGVDPEFVFGASVANNQILCLSRSGLDLFYHRESTATNTNTLTTDPPQITNPIRLLSDSDTKLQAAWIGKHLTQSEFNTLASALKSLVF